MLAHVLVSCGGMCIYFIGITETTPHTRDISSGAALAHGLQIVSALRFRAAFDRARDL